MKRLSLLILILMLSLAVQGGEVGATLSKELLAETDTALAEGTAFLLTIQNEDGSFGTYPHPAISALAAMGMHGTPGDQAKIKAAIDKAMTYVLSFRQDDGAIYPADRDMAKSANYPNYTTSIALLAMATLNRPEYLPAMRAARAYLQNSQFKDPESVDYGGIGYGRTTRADLSNGSWAAEALYYTDYLDEEPYAKDPQATEKTKKMWADLAIFVTRCQNLPETNKQPYVSSDARDRGGFIYRPFESKVDPPSREGDGKSALVSSGSMTYAGLKTMIYARLDKDDIRVKGAMNYAMRNYTLDENPGMGMQGLYYYLLTMAKAFDAYGQEVLFDAEGNEHVWRHDVIEKWLALQREDGSWANTSGRYFESMPELATSYSLIGLKVAAQRDTLEAK